jgi:hypothetical protein
MQNVWQERKLEVNVKYAKNLPNLPAPFGDSKIRLKQPNTFVSVSFEAQERRTEIIHANCDPDFEQRLFFDTQDNAKTGVGDCIIQVWMQADKSSAGGHKKLFEHTSGVVYQSIGKIVLSSEEVWRLAEIGGKAKCFELANVSIHNSATCSVFALNSPHIALSFGWVWAWKDASSPHSPEAKPDPSANKYDSRKKSFSRARVPSLSG